MSVRKTYWIAALASACACAVLSGCSPSAPEAPPPAPPPQAPPPPLAGGPVAYNDLPPTVVTMNPIPNPGDLSAQDRRRVYGPGYRLHPGDAHWVHRVGRVYGVTPPPAPVHVASVRPVAVVAPTVTPVAAPAAVVAPPTKLQQLQTAVGQSVTQNASLSVSLDIAQGKPGGVSLSLPGNLFQILRDQAAKFGFRRAARQTEVSATLAGDGYAITPSTPQTVPLKRGEALKFFWQVTPGQNANGPLHAQINAALTGQGAPKLLSLGSLQSAAVQVADQAEQAASGLHLPSLSHFLAKLFGHANQAAPASAAPAPAATPSPSVGPLHEVTLPIIGRMSVRAQIAAFLAFIALLILLLIQHNMADQRRAAERRRYRSMNAGYRPMDMDAEPSEPSPAIS